MPPPLTLEPVVYRVDWRDTIVSVNAAWDRRRSTPGDTLVRMCSWCRRVCVNGAWMDIEEAVDRLGLFERHGGNVTHSICESCIDSVTAVLDK